MKLQGRQLTLIEITRQSIFDANYVGCCDNCGKIIVNIATVKDENGKSYEIGLDCKKTLIDKPVIDKIIQSGDFMAKYNVKEYKQQTREAEKFLKFCSYPDIDIQISNNEVIIYDNKPNTQFPDSGLIGNTIYMQNIGYLNKIGLKDFIINLYNNNKAKLSKY